MAGRYAIVIAALTCVGCHEGSAPRATTSAAALAAAPVKTYACADGSTVEAWYPTTDTARVVYKRHSIDMTIAISADGARYVGGGWQWWTKGLTEGTRSPLAPGETIASAQGTVCTTEPPHGERG